MRKPVILVVSLALILVGPVLWGADEGAFKITVRDVPTELPLGMPLQVQVEVENATSKPIRVGWLNTPLRMDVRGEDGVKLKRCPWDRWSDPYVAVESHWLGTDVPADWSMTREVPICFDHVGVYTVQFRLLSKGPYRNQEGEAFEAWSGSVASKAATVRVTEPTGVDRMAYEAFHGNPVPFSDWNGSTGELLRRFPTSTYAAYLVWTRWGRVTAGVWKSAGDRDKFLAWLSGDPDQEYLTWNLPCAEDGRTDGAVTTRLGGRKALACRDRWLELVLDHHPDIWFADEVLLRLALDRYRLADKDACAAGLEELADHGRPDVASKASELLSAMRAKGMLVEKRK